MKRYKRYILTDHTGRVLKAGRYKEVMAMASQRYVYQHIYNDVLYTDGTYINKDGNIIQ